jgi:hypothetical protein
VPLAVLGRTFIVPFAVLAALALLGVSPTARAQIDDESASDADSSGGYAWGEPGGSAAAEPDDPLRIMGYLGAGVGFRPLRNLDTPFFQEFMSPAYLDLAGVVYLPGGAVRHGVGLGVSTTVSNDARVGVRMFQQWALTPAYYLLLPLRRLVPSLGSDWLQFQGHVGIPIVVGTALGSATGGVDVSVGAELGLGLNFKFLAGLGMYLEINAAAYGGTSNTIHPVLSADAGFVIDYEVLQ